MMSANHSPNFINYVRHYRNISLLSTFRSAGIHQPTTNKYYQFSSESFQYRVWFPVWGANDTSLVKIRRTIVGVIINYCSRTHRASSFDRGAGCRTMSNGNDEMSVISFWNGGQRSPPAATANCLVIGSRWVALGYCICTWKDRV